MVLLPYLIGTLAYWLNKDNPFFWDTIQLGSKHAHFYYENNFQTFLLPENIDSSHPPFFGMYLAVLWKIFGQSLAVSHFSILPFTLLSIYALNEIGNYFLGAKRGIWLVILLLVDPTFAAQNVLISPDAVLMSCFLLGILAIIKNKNWLLVLAALGLAMISMRGMMVVVVFYILQIYQNCIQHQERLSIGLLFRSSIVFIPSGLLALTFLSYHYYETGWIGYHEDSPWAASFERVDFKGFLRNIGIYIWRLLDFGRVFVMLPLAILLFIKLRSIPIKKQFSKFNFLLVLLLSSIFLLSPSLLIHKHLTAHRYLLPIFFTCSLLLLYLVFNNYRPNLSLGENISQIASEKWKKVLYSIVAIGLLSGNFWIYPSKIAQGWDATLAHLPYYNLRSNMMAYIEAEQIDFNEIGSVFPEVGARKFRELNGMEQGFPQADLNTNSYIFYSNVMNDFTDEEIKELTNNWQEVKRLENRKIFVVLYKR